MAKDWQNIVYECLKCGEKSVGNELKLVDPPHYDTIVAPDIYFVYITKDNIPYGGDTPPTEKNGDKVPMCPKCGKIHLYGLTLV